MATRFACRPEACPEKYETGAYAGFGAAKMLHWLYWSVIWNPHQENLN